MAERSPSEGMILKGQYRGYAMQLQVALVDSATAAGRSLDPEVFVEMDTMVKQAQAQIDRHIEYGQIANQFEESFLQPLVSKGFSKAKIVDAIADFASQSNWPSEVVKNLEYAAAALQDEGAGGEAMAPDMNADVITGTPISQRPMPTPEG
ncbi:MAG: hypothetical protein AAF685_14860 [Cyanobacteria bacterium P01_C01_bin.89]